METVVMVYPLQVAVLADGQKMVMDGKSGDWYAVGVVMDDALLTGWVNKAYVEACEWK